jgi:hypothetical protein
MGACLIVFNATFNNISVISWQSFLLVEETGVHGENHRPAACHWQTLFHLESVTKLHVFNYLASVEKPQVFYYLVSDANIFDISPRVTLLFSGRQTVGSPCVSSVYLHCICVP